jgi:hypothetical protein
MPWSFLLVGYGVSVAIETPVLLVGLSSRHGLGRRLFAGLWLTACTYPIVILVLPYCFSSRGIYLVVAETFAPVAEVTLFLAAFGAFDRPWTAVARDGAAIVLANLASFGLGEWLLANGWIDLATG